MAPRASDPWCFWTAGDQSLLAGLAAGALCGMLAASGWLTLIGRPLVDADPPGPRPAALRVDVNRADWPELMLLPSVGETLARRIVEARRLHGPYTCPEDLLRVRGMGEKTLEKLRPWLAPCAPGRK